MKKVLVFINLILILILSGCKTQNLNKTIYAFDTFIDVTLYEGTKEDLNNIETIFNKYNILCDNYHSYSGINNVYTINHSQGFVEVEEELIEIFEYINTFNNEFDKTFNILSGNLTSLWKDIINNNKEINEEEIKNELNIINNSKILIENKSIKIDGNATIDLGSVAKGYATEKVKEYLISKNISKYMINSGFSTVLLGEKKNNDYFKVGIKELDNKILKLKNISIGTSAISEQMIKKDNEIYHHIIDLSTGFSSNKYTTLSVIGENAALCDILSTACFSMNIDELENIVKKYKVSIIAIKDNKIVYETSGINYYE